MPTSYRGTAACSEVMDNDEMKQGRGRGRGVIQGGDDAEESDLEMSSEFSSGESSDGDDRGVRDAGGTPAGNIVALMSLSLVVF